MCRRCLICNGFSPSSLCHSNLCAVWINPCTQHRTHIACEILKLWLIAMYSSCCCCCYCRRNRRHGTLHTHRFFFLSSEIFQVDEVSIFRSYSLSLSLSLCVFFKLDLKSLRWHSVECWQTMQMEKTRRGSDCTKSSLIHTNNGDNHPPNCTLAHMIIKTNRTDSTCHDFALNNSSNVIVTQHAKRTHELIQRHIHCKQKCHYFFSPCQLSPPEKKEEVQGKDRRMILIFGSEWTGECSKWWSGGFYQRQREREPLK